MKTANELVSEMKSMGVRFRIEGGVVRLTASKELLTNELLENLREHKPEVFDWVVDGLLPSDLTGIDLQYYQDLYGVMTGDKFNMNPQDAEAEALTITKASMKRIYGGKVQDES